MCAVYFIYDIFVNDSICKDSFNHHIPGSFLDGGFNDFDCGDLGDSVLTRLYLDVVNQEEAMM